MDWIASPTTIVNPAASSVALVALQAHTGRFLTYRAFKEASVEEGMQTAIGAMPPFSFDFLQQQQHLIGFCGRSNCRSSTTISVMMLPTDCCKKRTFRSMSLEYFNFNYVATECCH